MPDLSHKTTTTIQIKTAELTQLQIGSQARTVALADRVATTISVELEPIQ